MAIHPLFGGGGTKRKKNFKLKMKKIVNIYKQIKAKNLYRYLIVISSLFALLVFLV